MKVVSSECNTAWFFNAVKRDDLLHVGLACFCSNAPAKVVVPWRNGKLIVGLPHRAIGNPMPCRMVNARLSLLV